MKNPTNQEIYDELQRHIAEERAYRSEYNDRLDKLFQLITSSHDRLISIIEIGNQRHHDKHEQMQREMRQEMREELSRVESRVDNHLNRISKSQVSTFELLSDMAESISDHTLAKKLALKQPN